MRCPRCKGAGVIDTSPPAAARAPWLSSDEDCRWCEGTGETVPDDADRVPAREDVEDAW